jgi:hypothetical protein
VHSGLGLVVGIFFALFFDFIPVSKLKQGVIAGKSLQSSVATAFQTFVRVRPYVNLGRMA